MFPIKTDSKDNVQESLAFVLKQSMSAASDSDATSWRTYHPLLWADSYPSRVDIGNLEKKSLVLGSVNFPAFRSSSAWPRPLQIRTQISRLPCAVEELRVDGRILLCRS